MSLILDHVRTSSDGMIIVPPFHSGHLGLLPGSPVHISHSFSTPDDLYEVVITPFHKSVGSMININCLMENRRGVEAKFSDAIKECGANAANEVSSSMELLNNHKIDNVVDISSIPRQTIRERTKAILSKWCDESLFSDSRLVSLFEQIVLSCSSVLLFDDITGRPKIDIEHIYKTGVIKEENKQDVQKATGKPYHSAVELDPAMWNRIKRHLRIKKEEISYLLISGTSDKSLRVLFLTTKYAEELVHIGFYHSDEIGALSCIKNPLARAGLDIVTGLLRSDKNDENVWEAILNTSAIKGLNANTEKQESFNLIADLIVKNATLEERKALVDNNVFIGQPRYPKPKKEDKDCKDDLVKSLEKYKNYKYEINENIDVEDDNSVSPKLKRNREKLLSDIEALKENSAPTIFISYPTAANEHAKSLKEALELNNRYIAIDGMEEHGDDIKSVVMEKIRMCDFFVGIWHYEGKPGKNSKISPWLTCEYGAAEMIGKKNLIVHSEHLNPKIWKRINPGTNQPEYSDLTFEKDMIKAIVDYCDDYFYS